MELPNPAIADGSGRLTAYMPSNTTYDLELRTSADVHVWTVPGVQGVPSNEVDLDIEGIAGEALADRDVVFLSNGTGGTTVGRWYKGDADIVARSTGANIVGIAPLAAGVGASTTIRLQGRLDGFTGLTPGAAYYISQVAGALTSVAPPNARFIGIADTTTSLVMTVGGVAQAQPADPIFNSVQISSTNASALDVAGGIVAGTGNVQVVDATGKIPAIDSTRFANLSGTNLTGVAKNASNETIGGLWDFDAPTVFSAPVDRNIIIATNTGNKIAIRIRGNAVDNLAVIDFTDSTETIAFGSIGITPGGGLTYTAPFTGHTFGGGRINTNALQPGFFAYRSSNQAGGPGIVQVVFDVKVYDPTNAFNSATGVFTAPVPGTYHFCARVNATSLASGGVFISPQTAVGARIESSTTNPGHGGCAFFTLAALEQVTVLVAKNDASGIVGGVTDNAAHTYFSGRLVP